jgi:hypothetical protein
MSVVDPKTVEESVKKSLFIQTVSCGTIPVEVIFNLTHVHVFTSQLVAPELRKGLALPAEYMAAFGIPTSGHTILKVGADSSAGWAVADRMLRELAREIGGPPRGAVADARASYFLWFQDGAATAVVQAEQNSQPFVLDATIGDHGLNRRKSKICYRPVVRPRIAVDSMWVAPDRRRRLTAFRLLREVAGYYGVQAGDLAWSAPFTDVGIKLARRVSGDKLLIVGDHMTGAARAGLV